METTVRLYWERPTETDFTATLIRAVSLAAGEGEPNTGLILDQTLFYPGGGGQPCDTGVIEIEGRQEVLPVVGVREENGEILHLAQLPAGLEGSPNLPAAGLQVRGRINWRRRFDHMQQHTGQHVLSQAFVRELQAETVGFHLGAEYVTIDLALPDIAPEDLARVETTANEIGFRDLPVSAREYLPDELPPAVRRRITKDTGRIRVVHIGDFDACACGGTHVASTGQIGLIKINEVERAHGGTRVVFRCGWRALRDYRAKESILAAAAKALARAAGDVVAGIEALAAKAEASEKEVKDLRRALLTREAQLLVSKPAAGDAVVAALPGKTPEELRYLAREAAAAGGKPVVVFTREPRFSAVIARGTDSKFDARAVAARLSAAFGARGGGSPEVAQVGAKEAVPGKDDEIAAAIRRLLADEQQ